MPPKITSSASPSVNASRRCSIGATLCIAKSPLALRAQLALCAAVPNNDSKHSFYNIEDMYVCMYIHTYIHTYMYVCMYVYMYVCIYEKKTSQGDFRLMSFTAGRCSTPLILNDQFRSLQRNGVRSSYLIVCVSK